MAKTKNQGKRPTSAAGTLPESFNRRRVVQKGSSPKKGSPKKRTPSSPASSSQSLPQPSRQQHSSFLTYVRFAMTTGKCAESRDQAAAINTHYQALSAQDKKAFISEFHRAGGKKSGLSCCFSQAMQVRQLAADKQWEGYVNFGGLCELWKVGLWECPEHSSTYIT